MRSTITLNGINSNTITGLLIQNLPPISKPLMRTQIEEIDGRDGDIITKLGFSAYNKEITIGLYGDFDINQIIQYFTSQGTVVFSNEPDKYYYYQIIDQIDFERLIRYRTATVTMHCQPFKYSTTEGTQVFDNSSNLLTIPNSTTTTNGVTVTANNNILTISGTASAATEFYIPIDTLSLSVGKYGMYALGSGTNPEACSLRVIYNSPSNANSFGGNYVTLKNNQTVSLIANLSNAKTYNYVYLYIAANKAMDFTLNLSIEDAAQSVVTGEGNLITLEGTAFAPFDKFDLEGDTTQQTYSGKNLWNMTSISSTSANVTISGPASDGEYSLTWTGGFTAVLSSISGLNSQTSYTVSFKHKGEALTLRKVGMSTSLISTERDTDYTSYSYTFTGETSLSLEFLRRSATTNVTAYIKDFQLETGSATSFEPYVGGIPAPNPDYPQEVQVVTGEQTVTITDGQGQSQSYEVNLGKNMLNITSVRTEQPSSSTITLADGVVNGTWTGGFNAYIQSANSDDISLDNTKTYTISFKAKGDAIRFRLANNVEIAVGTNTDYTTYSYTISGLSQIHLLINRNASLSSGSYSIKDIQLELGSTATTYAPYFTPIELCKIGDYQDYIYKSGDDWYVHKVIGKYIYNNDLSGNGISATRVSMLTPSLDVESGMAQTAGVFYSNMLTPTVVDYSGIGGTTNTSQIRVNCSIDIASTYDGFRALAAQNNLTIYYPLATPTDARITDSSVVAQLEALVTDAHAYKNTTTLVSTSQQLPHIMSVEVAKNNDATITNSGNTTAKPVMTVYGSGTVGIYLNGNQIFNVNIGNNQYITIDTANMEAYKDTTDNLMNRLVDGDYSNFVLQTGENQISFSGSVSKLEISNYSRWI